MNDGQLPAALAVAEQAKASGFIDAFVRAGELTASDELDTLPYRTISDRIQSLQGFLQSMQDSSIAESQEVNEVLAALGSRQVFSYFLAQDTLYLMHIAAGDVAIIDLELKRDRLSELVYQYSENPNDIDMLDKLGAMLFPQDTLPPSGTHLFIAPDDELNTIALTSMRVNKQFLIERNTVSLIPGVSALARMVAPSAAGPQSNEKVVIGDPLGDLPAAKLEAMEIGKQLGVEPLVGSAATIESMSQLKSPKVLHIASHTGVDHLGPWLGLADAQVTGNTILNLRLKPELAVLASCSSGVGEDRYLWGSLGGLFLINGTPATIVSLWSIEDQVTQRLIADFYRYHLSGQSVAESLSNAQKQAIKNGYAPRQWGAFYGVGTT